MVRVVFKNCNPEIDIENINKKQLEDMSIYELNYLYKKIKNRG